MTIKTEEERYRHLAGGRPEVLLNAAVVEQIDSHPPSYKYDPKYTICK